MVRARIKLVGGRPDADGAFDRVFDFCAHQGIQSEIRERLVIAQALRFHTQHGPNDIANRLRNDGSPALPAQSIRSSGASHCSRRWPPGFRRLRRRISCSSGFSCKPRKNCRHLAQSTRIAITWAMPASRKDSSNATTSPGEIGDRSLPGEEFGDSLIARHIAVTAENAPVHRKGRHAESASIVGQRVEKGIGGRIVALRRIAKDARDG